MQISIASLMEKALPAYIGRLPQDPAKYSPSDIRVGIQQLIISEETDLAQALADAGLALHPESEDLLANVRRVAQYIRDTCIVGPITGHQGAGFLTGLISKMPVKDLQKILLADYNILTGTSGDPNVLRLLPPFTLKEAEVDVLANALQRIG